MDFHVYLQFVMFLFGVISISARDYYEILGVKRDASEKEIKRQFRQLGMLIRPSKTYLNISIEFYFLFQLSNIIQIRIKIQTQKNNFGRLLRRTMC